MAPGLTCQWLLTLSFLGACSLVSHRSLQPGRHAHDLTVCPQPRQAVADSGLACRSLSTCGRRTSSLGCCHACRSCPAATRKPCGPVKPFWPCPCSEVCSRHPGSLWRMQAISVHWQLLQAGAGCRLVLVDPNPAAALPAELLKPGADVAAASVVAVLKRATLQPLTLNEGPLVDFVPHLTAIPGQRFWQEPYAGLLCPLLPCWLGCDGTAAWRQHQQAGGCM